MKKRRTLLDEIGQEMADKMTPAQRAEARELWDAIILEGMTEENTSRYQLFCSKTSGTAGPHSPIKRRLRSGRNTVELTYPFTVTVAKDTLPDSTRFQSVKRAPQATEFVLFMLPSRVLKKSLSHAV
jgi:hypothetical protein